MHFLFFWHFWWQTNLGFHKYPAGVQLAFVQQVEADGATENEAKCWLRSIENKWTFNQAIDQYVYYLRHGRFTDEGWKVYISCLPKKN
jgi:hypothetical protein